MGDAPGVPLSCQIKLTYGGQNLAAIAPESVRLALALAKPVMRGLLDERHAFAAVVLDAVDRPYNCGPQHVARFAREAVLEGVRAWQYRRTMALDRIARVVWPMAEARASGQQIMAEAMRANRSQQSPLTEAEVLAECRAIAKSIMARRGNASGRR